jgi:hypothetical protein
MTGLTFSHQGLIESFNARNGKRLWIAPLPDEAGATRVPMSSTHATFSPDGQTAYMTAIVSGVYDHSWLYAVDARR